MKKTTINDIARESGVSLSTVSLVLNNNPRISEQTRTKVLSIVNKHGYQPNSHARGLASRSSRTVSVVVPQLNHVFADIYFGEIVSGVYDEASAKGYKVLLDVANQNFLSTREYISLLQSRRVDGMLFIGSNVEDRFPLEFERHSFPFLLVNHYIPGHTLNSMQFDYSESARLAAAHLVELGHKRIGLIAGLNTYTGMEFRDQFIRHCRQMGLAEDDVPWVDGGRDWSQAGGFEGAERLMQSGRNLTAIMAGNDRMATGAIRYLQKHGLSVPGDVSVMGVDDIPASAFTTPGLTTIRHDLYKLGTLSFDRILSLFQKEITACDERLPVEIVIRESTGPAPAA